MVNCHVAHPAPDAAMYVLSIDVAPLDSLAEKTVWRFFDDLEPAEDKYYLAEACAQNGTIVRVDKRERVQVSTVRLYEVEAPSRVVARDLVIAGKGRPLKDMNNPLAHLSPEQLQQYWDDFIADD